MYTSIQHINQRLEYTLPLEQQYISLHCAKTVVQYIFQAPEQKLSSQTPDPFNKQRYGYGPFAQGKSAYSGAGQA